MIDLKDSKVLVTGGTGFFGRAIRFTRGGQSL